MKKEIIVEGVVVVYNGKFWGCQYYDGETTHRDYGEFENAEISDPKYCKKPTDIAWGQTNGYNYEFDKLKKGKLVKIRKTVTYETLSPINEENNITPTGLYDVGISEII